MAVETEEAATPVPAAGGRLLDDLTPGRLIPALTAGIVLGVLEVLIATSFATLIFAGPLASRLSEAIGLSLFAGAVIIATIALFSSMRGVVASVQDTSAAVLAVAAASVIEGLPANVDPFATVVAMIVVTSASVGIALLAIGAFRVGDLVRFIPFPVIAGFLAATGWLLFRGGIGVVTGIDLGLSTLDDLASPDALVRWLPALAFAVFLIVLLGRVQHYLALPGALLGAIALFYGVLAFAGISVSEAHGEGLLLGPFPGGSLWNPEITLAVADAEWPVVLAEFGSTATAVVIVMIALLLNASGIELAVNEDGDLNRELRAAGVGNVIAAAGGGIPGYHTLAFTALAHKVGGGSRIVGLSTAAFCVAVLIFGASVLSYFPTPVAGAMLLFLALGFLIEWLIQTWSRVSRAEWLVIAAIVGIVGRFGFLAGVGAGLLAAVVLFVVDYSRSEIVKHELTGTTFRSRVERDAAQRSVLRARGESIYILGLQGFVFFGTANRLLERLRRRVADPTNEPLRFLILAFGRVTGVDSSAILSFARAKKLAENNGFVLIVTSMSERVKAKLQQGGLEETEGVLHYFPDVDHAMEWAEDRLLGAAGSNRKFVGDELWRQIAGGTSLDPTRLLPYLERVELAEGQVLIEQGAESRDVYFLESGRLSARLVTADGTRRLQAMGAGTVVGETALYRGGVRAATVVADEPSVAYRLTHEALERTERDDPDLAAALHRLFARLIADRLADTLRTMSAVLN